MDDKFYLSYSASPFVIADGTTLAVVAISREAEKYIAIPADKIKGMPLFELFSPISNIDEPKGEFSVFINHEKRGLYESVPWVSPFRYILRVVREEGRIYAFFRPALSSTINRFASKARDIVITLTKENRVFEITPHMSMAMALANNQERHPLVEEIVGKNVWLKLVEKRRMFDKYVDDHIASMQAIEWKLLFEGAPSLETGWKSVDSENILKGGFAFNGDSLIQADVVLKPITRFALLLNLSLNHFKEESGYRIGIITSDQDYFATLKKNGRSVIYKKIDLPQDGKCTVEVERSYARFVFRINGLEVFRFRDYPPVIDGLSSAGIQSHGGNVVGSLRIYGRPFAEKTEAELFFPVRVELDILPNRYFDCHFEPVCYWLTSSTPEQFDSLHMHEITDVVQAERERENILNSAYTSGYHGFVGTTPAIRNIVNQVEKFADTKATILIEGPTGVGKEVLARAIHERSGRSGMPYIRVDCASLPSGVIESELFGHEKGAYTGATSKTIGRFEAADKGTLFLDEIGNIDLQTQAKLLSFLEERKITRVGSLSPISIDVRIIAATNAPLFQLVNTGQFREDLYYRLKVVPVSIPPLKERLDDIPLLVNYLINKINSNHGTSIGGIDPAVMSYLSAYEWPGNVRELYNTLINMCLIKRSGILSERPELIRGVIASHEERGIMPEEVRMAKIIDYGKSRDFFSAKECAAMLSVSIPTINRNIRQLVKSGLLRSLGKGPSCRYSVRR